MSDCDKYKIQFSSYLEGELSSTQKKELEDHFTVCNECKETIRQIRIIQNSLQQVPPYTTSPDFEKRLHEQIFHNPEKNGFFPIPLQNWKIPAMGSALVLASLGLFLIIDHTPDPNNPVLSNPGGNLSPAATQISNNIQLNKIGNAPNSQTGYDSKTLINDTSQTDSSTINREGLQLVKDN